MMRFARGAIFSACDANSFGLARDAIASPLSQLRREKIESDECVGLLVLAPISLFSRNRFMQVEQSAGKHSKGS